MSGETNQNIPVAESYSTILTSNFVNLDIILVDSVGISGWFIFHQTFGQSNQIFFSYSEVKFNHSEDIAKNDKDVS